jgi:hypothetical protein
MKSPKSGGDRWTSSFNGSATMNTSSATTPDATSENGAPLTLLGDAPGYATSESGHVHRHGHPRRGDVWFAIKPTAQIVIDRTTPGTAIIRRTGRFLFPVRWEDGSAGVVAWTPPPQPTYAPASPPAEDPDDCPF